MTDTTLIRQAAEAVRQHAREQHRYLAREPDYGVVRQVDPLQVELQGSSVVLDADQLIVAQGVRSYDEQFGLAVGDALKVTLMWNGDWLAEAVVSDLDDLSSPGVHSVSAGDSSIAVGGTARDRTVAVAALGITTPKLADGAVTSAKILDGTITLADLAFSSMPPGGAAGGDLTGSYPSPAIKASVGLTGAPTAPTAAADTSTTQLASTAFVIGQAATATPLMDGAAAAGTSLRYARGDHVHPTDTSRAPLASPTFTGVPAGPTAAVDTSTTQLATTAFVLGQAAAATPLMDGAAAVGTSTRYARADHVHPVDTSRAPLASPTLTGVPAAPTAAAGTSTTQLATTAFVAAANASRAPLASPTFTGVPAAPTAAVDTNTTQLATTAFVLGQAASATPLMDGTAAVGTSTRYARGDHVHPTDTSRAPLANPVFTGGATAPMFIASGGNSFQGGLPNSSSWLLYATIPGQAYNIFGVWGQILYWSDTNNGGHVNDVNLYRGGNSLLQTDSNFTSLNGITGNSLTSVGRIIGNSGVKEVFLGDVYGDAGVPGMRLGGDTNLYRASAGMLKTDGQMTVAGRFFQNGGTEIMLADVFGDNGVRGMRIAGDTYLYRNAANQLRTAGYFIADSALMALGGNSVPGTGATLQGNNTYNAGNNWMSGMVGSGIYYDGANWQNKTFGGNNGWAALGVRGASNPGGFDLYGVNATGASDRSYTPAQFIAQKFGSWTTDGTLTTLGRVFSGAAGTGGIWVDGGSSQFVGSNSATKMGLYNGGWAFVVDNTGTMIIGTAQNSWLDPAPYESGSFRLNGTNGWGVLYMGSSAGGYIRPQGAGLNLCDGANGSVSQIGFLGASPVARQTAHGTTVNTRGVGTTWLIDNTTTGGVGSTAYTIQDVVAALKNYGLLVA